MRYHPLLFPTIALGVLCVAEVRGHAQQPLAAAPPSVVLQDVTVVDTRTGALTPHRSVVITDGKIAAITSSGIKPTAGVRVLHAAGQFVVPGYADMHIHITNLAQDNPSLLPLLIANGVTTVREETPTPANKQIAAQFNADAAAGKLAAPEIVFEGGEEHLPQSISAEDASNHGMPSMDHLGAGLGLVLDCSTDTTAIRADVLAHGYKPSLPPNFDFILNPRAFDGAQNAPFYQRVLDTYSPEKCTALSQTFAKNHTWQTLTLIRLRTQDWGNDPQYRTSPDLAYMDPQVRAHWEELGDRFTNLPPAAVTTLQNYYGLQKRVAKLMSENNVPILSGSDVGGIWLVPGVSLHQEFHEMAAAGFTTLRILQTTTLNPALFLHREEVMGTVEPGRLANLVLLKDNPLADSANLSHITSMVVQGRLFTGDDLKRLKHQTPNTETKRP